MEKARENGFQKTFVADIHDLTTIFPPNPDPSSELYKLISSSSSTRGSPNERKGEDREIKWEFDAVFSNAVLHWCKRDPEAVAREVARVLRKGGRFAGEMGGFMNLVGKLNFALSFYLFRFSTSHYARKLITSCFMYACISSARSKKVFGVQSTPFLDVGAIQTRNDTIHGTFLLRNRIRMSLHGRDFELRILLSSLV